MVQSTMYLQRYRVCADWWVLAEYSGDAVFMVLWKRALA